jgi:hypothetical protein
LVPQASQHLAEVMEGVRLVVVGPDPGPDQPGPQAGRGTDWMDAHGERGGHANRVRDAGLLELPRNLPRMGGSARRGGLQIAVLRQPGQILRYEFPVVLRLAPADDLASHEELEVQAARAWSRGAHALGIPAQGPKCALIDQVSQ